MAEVTTTPKPRNAPIREVRFPETPQRSIDRGSSGEKPGNGLEGVSLKNRRVDAITACCDARGDDAKFGAELLAECAQLTPRLQADAIEHFDAEAEIWKRANRGEA